MVVLRWDDEALIRDLFEDGLLRPHICICYLDTWLLFYLFCTHSFHFFFCENINNTPIFWRSEHLRDKITDELLFVLDISAMICRIHCKKILGCCDWNVEYRIVAADLELKFEEGFCIVRLCA